MRRRGGEPMPLGVIAAMLGIPRTGSFGCHGAEDLVEVFRFAGSGA